MQEYSLSIILKKTFQFSHIWLWKQLIVITLIIHEYISKNDAKSEGSTWSPGNKRINDKLEKSWSSPGNLGPDEGPAQVKTHDGHPREHGHAEEVSNVTSNLADKLREKFWEVIDKKEVSGEEENGENIAQDYFTMEIIEFRYIDVHKEGYDQEETAYAATDCVDKTKIREVMIKIAIEFHQQKCHQVLLQLSHVLYGL